MSQEALVDTVCDFTGLRQDVDRDLILSALRAKGNNTEAVVAEFYEDESKFRQQYTWTELPFLADRDGSLPDAANLPTFSIRAADDTGVIDGVAPNISLPPSRPPSRTDNRSPLGRMVGWTANGAAGAPNSRAQEEADLQRALAESAAHSGLQVPPPQESGVTGGQGNDVHLPFFGPAVRDHYDQDQWAVVPLSRAMSDPRPSARRREPGVPAFLRCRKTGTQQHRLGALLTMYHEIPAARNMLLETGKPASTYGINNFWWKGEPILPKTQEEPPAQQDEDAMQWQETEPDPFEELHRLMAFLDLTDRSYGTADVLGDLRVVADAWGADAAEIRFFDLLRDHHSSQGTLSRLFWGVQIFSFSSSALSMDEDPERFAVFEMRLTSGAYQRIETLYDAWDELFWIDVNSTNEDEASLRTAAITEVGDVLTMTFGGEGGLVRPLEIPEHFYIDRYMAERRNESMEQQLKIRQLRRALAEAERLEFEVSKWWSVRDQLWKDKISLSRKVIDDRLDKEKDLRFKALRRRWSECVDTPDYFHFIPGYMDHKIIFTDDELALLKQWEWDRQHHESVIEEISTKNEDYAKLKENINAEIRVLTKKNSVPCPEEGWKPTHRYNLRGVATSNDIYIARRAEPDLIDMDGESSPSDQWWRLSYVADDEVNPLRVSKTTVEEARHAASTEGKAPFLVYANDAAMDEIPKSLPAALRTFVKFDNRYFKQELIEEAPEAGGSTPPNIPPKPKLPARAPLQQEVPQQDQQRQEAQQPLVTFDDPPLEPKPTRVAGGVRTSSTEIFPGASIGSNLHTEDDEGTEMIEIHLVGETNLTPSSGGSTVNIHTPSTLADSVSDQTAQQQRDGASGGGSNSHGLEDLRP